MNNKRWVKIWFLMITFISVFIGSFNYIVDPYGYFSRKDKYIQNLTRVNKAEILNNKLYTNSQIYIIGTSRQMRVNPQLIENLTGDTTQNVNITGSTLSENKILAKKIKSLGKSFIYGFDCASFNKYRVDNFHEITNRYLVYKRELEKDKNIYLSLLNLDITLLSINHIIDRFKGKNYYKIENYENNHNYKINKNVIIGGVNGENQKSSYSEYTSYKNEEVIDLANIADENDIFVILPKYVAWYKMFQKYKHIEDKYFYGIKTLVNKTRAKVWIFYGANSITKNSNNFDLNGWHFKPKIANLIFSKIYNKNADSIPADFGILLTPQNVEIILSSLKKKLKKYELDKKIFHKKLSRKDIYNLYITIFGREPDIAGLNYFEKIDSLSIIKLTHILLNSKEGKSIYFDNISNKEFIEKIYKNLSLYKKDKINKSEIVSKIDNDLSKNDIVQIIIKNEIIK